MENKFVYFLIYGYDFCHDGDEWLGIYDNVEKLESAYYEAQKEYTKEEGYSGKLYIYQVRINTNRYIEVTLDQLKKG